MCKVIVLMFGFLLSQILHHILCSSSSRIFFKVMLLTVGAYFHVGRGCGVSPPWLHVGLTVKYHGVDQLPPLHIGLICTRRCAAPATTHQITGLCSKSLCELKKNNTRNKIKCAQFPAASSCFYQRDPNGDRFTGTNCTINSIQREGGCLYKAPARAAGPYY